MPIGTQMRPRDGNEHTDPQKCQGAEQHHVPDLSQGDLGEHELHGFTSAMIPINAITAYQMKSPSRLLPSSTTTRGPITIGLRDLAPMLRNPTKSRETTPIRRDRRIMVSAHELEGVRPASCSRRNQSALAINGRNSNWSKNQDHHKHGRDGPTYGTEVPLALSQVPRRSRRPEGVTLVLPRSMASAATTKNQPPDMDIIMFQMSGGMANGTARRQNRLQGLRRKLRAASSSSCGILRSE